MPYASTEIAVINTQALMREVAEANEDQIARKRAAAHQELEEEMAVAEYIRQRDARDQVGVRSALCRRAASLSPWHARCALRERDVRAPRSAARVVRQQPHTRVWASATDSGLPVGCLAGAVMGLHGAHTRGCTVPTGRDTTCVHPRHGVFQHLPRTHSPVPRQAIAAEKERAAQEKEMEVARLRGLQERVADRQSEVDEMRARRWQVRSGAACR